MGDNEFAKFKAAMKTEERIIIFDAFGKDIDFCYGKKQLDAKRKLYNKLALKFKKLIADSSVAYNNVEGFERLSKTKKQQTTYPTLDIFRYEIRKFSNLRCMFIIDSESKYIFLIGAFNEDGDKKKRKQ